MLADWLIGCILSVCSSGLTSLGFTLQKQSHHVNSELDLRDRQHYLFQRLWRIGFAIYLLGQILGMTAMGFASQAIVAVLTSLSLVFNGWFAHRILHEAISQAYIYASAIIILGSCLVVAVSSHERQDYDLDTLLSLFLSPPIIIYLSLTAMALLYCFWRRSQLFILPSSSGSAPLPLPSSPVPIVLPVSSLSLITTHSQEHPDQRASHPSLPHDPVSGSRERRSSVPLTRLSSATLTDKLLTMLTTPANSSPYSPLASPSPHTQLDEKTNSAEDQEVGIRFVADESSEWQASPSLDVHESSSQFDFESQYAHHLAPFAIGISALLAGYSVLLAKCTIQLIKDSIIERDASSFLSPYTYIILVIFLASAIGSVHYLNEALRVAPVVIVYPLYFASSTLHIVIGGLLYFQEITSFSPVKAIVFTSGLVLNMYGVYMASQETKTSSSSPSPDTDPMLLSTTSSTPLPGSHPRWGEDTPLLNSITPETAVYEGDLRPTRPSSLSQSAWLGDSLLSNEPMIVPSGGTSPVVLPREFRDALAQSFSYFKAEQEGKDVDNPSIPRTQRPQQHVRRASKQRQRLPSAPLKSLGQHVPVTSSATVPFVSHGGDKNIYNNYNNNNTHRSGVGYFSKLSDDPELPDDFRTKEIDGTFGHSPSVSFLASEDVDSLDLSRTASGLSTGSTRLSLGINVSDDKGKDDRPRGGKGEKGNDQSGLAGALNRATQIQAKETMKLVKRIIEPSTVNSDKVP